MKNLPDMSKYPSPLKITFEDGDVWENVRRDYVYRAPANPQPDEELEEDEIGVTYQGMKYSLKASEIKAIKSLKKS
ncbi:hypothetical protein [Helicobacter vulpis]|uniref:hypothetical protein n=1 Tax=Helicobacter vulpis TaxID=2316076 RepID=UPI000EAF00AD|nr:hypothetical protein [Helicobacter vulpis]